MCKNFPSWGEGLNLSCQHADAEGHSLLSPAHQGWASCLPSALPFLPFGISLHPPFSLPLFPPTQIFSESRYSSSESFSVAQPPVGAEGGRQDQPCQLRRFQASAGPCRPLPAPKSNPDRKQAGLMDPACSPCTSWPLKTRLHHLFARK